MSNNIKFSRKIPATILLWLFGLLVFIPLYWLFISSFKSNYEIGLTPPTLFPLQWELSNYSNAWKQQKLGQAFLNSIFVSTVTTLGILVLSSLCAYVLAKGKIVGKKIIFSAIIASIMIPPTVIMIPLFYIITKIHLYDNLWGIILPFCVTPFAIFFTKQYIEEIPNDLLEASRIDGLNEWGIFFNIIIPTITPALVTLAVIEFVNNWNSFIMPLVLLNSTEKFTVPLKIGSLITSTDVPSFSLLLAINVISILPVVLLFLGFSKYFIQDLIKGAVKG